MTTVATTIHPSAIVDEGAVLDEGCRVWHFVHISAGRASGVDVHLGKTSSSATTS